MFRSYNLEGFGDEMRRIRRNCRMSQIKVTKIMDISEDTLRRIENAKVLPTYETLTKLSHVYKRNLLMVLDRFQTSKLLLDIYEEVDSYMVHNKPDAMTFIKAKLKKIENECKQHGLIVPEEIHQLEILLKATISFNNRTDHTNQINLINDAISRTNYEYSSSNSPNCVFNNLELRLILTKGLFHADICEFEESNRILLSCYNNLKENQSYSKETIKVLVKLIYNISYNYHQLSAHNLALEYACKGIDILLEEEMIFLFPHLYGRKGIAEYKLGNKDYANTMYECLTLMKIFKDEHNYEIFKDVFNSKYNTNF